MRLPKQLQNQDYRFIKVNEKTKAPIEPGWQKDKNYSYNDPEFKKYVETARSIGLATGFGSIAVVDIDKPEIIPSIQKKLPKTLTVQTGSGGCHLYYKIPDLDKKIILMKDKVHYGEVQFKGQQVIIPNSLHPSGKTYEITHSTSIAEITKQQLSEAIEPYVNSEDLSSKERPFVNNNLQLLDPKPIIDHFKGLKKQGTQYVGPCPFHDSEGGRCWNISAEEGLFKCHHCGATGNIFYLIAINEGLIKSTEECTKLKPEHYKLALGLIQTEKYGNQVLKGYYKAYYEGWVGSAGPIAYPQIARLLLAEHPDELFIHVYSKNQSKAAFFWYDTEQGMYLPDAELRIEQLNKGYCGDRATIRTDLELVHAIKKELPITYFENFTPDTNFVVLNNVTLNVNTGEIVPHDPKYNAVSKNPHNWNPNAKCPFWIEHLNTVLVRPEDRAAMQEWFGYLLLQDYRFNKLAFWEGSGGNGKGVTANVMIEFVGKTNAVGIDIEKLLNGNFAKSDLYGKHLNHAGELSRTELKNTEQLKVITGNNPISADVKNKARITFTPYAKQVISTNEVPYCYDKSSGWYQRPLIFKFLVTLRGTDKMIAENILAERFSAEMEGILVWAIEGLQRLLKNNKFSNDPGEEKIAEAFDQYVNASREFFEDTIHITSIEKDCILIDALVGLYSNKCIAEGRSHITRQRLVEDLKYYVRDQYGGGATNCKIIRKDIPSVGKVKALQGARLKENVHGKSTKKAKKA